MNECAKKDTEATHCLGVLFVYSLCGSKVCLFCGLFVEYSCKFMAFFSTFQKGFFRQQKYQIIALHTRIQIKEIFFVFQNKRLIKKVSLHYDKSQIVLND